MPTHQSRIGLFFVLVAATVSVTQAEVFIAADAHEGAIESSRALLVERIESGHPGLSVAVSVDGETVWAEGFGYADIDSQSPVTQHTQFRIGSTSKSITAVALCLLMDEGAIDIDESVHSYVPTFPEKKFTITPRQLAGNLGGIRHYEGVESRSRVHYGSLTQGLIIFQDDPLVAEPGTAYVYSSYGFNLLGVCIEGASGMDYLSFVSEKIFEPLGMFDSAADDITKDLPNRATFYIKGRKGPRVAAKVDDSYKWPSGGLISTPSDMVKFGSSLLSPGFISEDSLEQLFASQRMADGKETGYGLGFRIAEPNDDRSYHLFHHGGSSLGGKSMLMIAPEPGVVVSLLTNYGTYNERDSDAIVIVAAFAE